MSSNAERFGKLVKQRRTDLDLTQLEVGAAGGPSNTKQTEIEKGELVSLLPNMAKKLDKGLRWEQGSARRAWLGGDPTPLEAAPRGLNEAIAEVERSSLSESTKRYIIDHLRSEASSSLPEAGERA